MAIEFRILGPVEAWAGDARIVLFGPRQQRALAALLVDADKTVSIERIVDAVWGDDPPTTARRQVQDMVTRLRRALSAAGGPPDTITTVSRGYAIHTAGHRLDALVFSDLVAAARQTSDTDPATAADTLRTALRLWRGPALAGLDAPGLRSAAATWDEQRLSAWEQCLRLELGLGRHREVISELTALADEQPFGEGATGLLLSALARSGRRAEAMDAYQRFRQRLVHELGVEPGPELRALHQAILLGEIGAKEPGPSGLSAAPAPVPATLPKDLSTFAGRDRELRQLDEILAAAGGRPTAVLISALTGTAGVGKTALAVHWARRVADQYRDGQLYLNLRGFSADGSAMAPREALRVLLQALGVGHRQNPPDLDAQVGLYRSLLAGRRMILVLDNAKDADQVRPLLPTAAGCLAVVTSRNELTGLVAVDGAHPVRLDVLTPEEAHDLLVRRLGADRLAAEPAAAKEIISQCAHLPLALAVVAARATIRSDLPLAALADELGREGRALDALDAGDPSADVRTVFSWSYQALTADAARLFRLLGVHPGPDISTAAAASLVGVPAHQVRVPLAELIRASLLTPTGSDRYTTHDLLRDYAAELSRTAEPVEARESALRRLVDHYLHGALVAADLLETGREPITHAAPGPGVALVALAGRDDGLEWFIREHATLMAVLDRTANAGLHGHTWRLALALAGYLDNQGHWLDWIASARLAVEAAHELADREAEARAHRILARAYAQMGTYAEAETHYKEALTLFAELDDSAGQASTRFSLAWMAELQEQYGSALGHSEQALALYESAGHLVGQARALNSVGWHHALLGRYPETLTYCHRALALQQELGDEDGQAASWDSIGYAHHRLGQLGEATRCYEHALDLYRRCGDRLNEADVLAHVGDTHAAANDVDAAAAAWRRAAEILDELGHDNAEGVRAKLSAIGRG